MAGGSERMHGISQMKLTNLPIEGLKLIELQIFQDSRGFFVERFNEEKFREFGLPTQWAQDNHSKSLPGVLRGLHFQTGDDAQGKLVGVIRGRIWDVAVDARKGSPTFGQHYAVELSDSNGKLLWIPKGFAHGFCVVGGEAADVMYKVDRKYSPGNDGGILWNDPALKIEWPIEKPLISDKDAKLPSFAEFISA
jgi:dTDP-4-dehydrorhamnose 3,5-epimerase